MTRRVPFSCIDSAESWNAARTASAVTPDSAALLPVTFTDLGGALAEGGCRLLEDLSARAPVLAGRVGGLVLGAGEVGPQACALGTVSHQEPSSVVGGSVYWPSPMVLLDDWSRASSRVVLTCDSAVARIVISALVLASTSRTSSAHWRMASP